ncbi:NUDIX hydrolase [Mesobacillus maritimus]|uniref:NUDIX hydrolase n=1 Tax=Mesobacillus maritimus TaxID=1643336 RepID=UPI00203B8EBB|nr:NUDIX hydrolase [Mesobacillus maritimus]
MGYIEDLRKIVGHRPLILVGAVAVIVDEFGRILLEERKFPKNTWGLPGGLMELGESTEDVARREVFEETGLTVKDLKLINVYSGKNHFSVAENGDEFYIVTIAYSTDQFEGEITVDKNESVSIAFVDPENLPTKMIKSHKAIIEEYLRKQNEAES